MIPEWVMKRLALESDEQFATWELLRLLDHAGLDRASVVSTEVDRRTALFTKARAESTRRAPSTTPAADALRSVSEDLRRGRL